MFGLQMGVQRRLGSGRIGRAGAEAKAEVEAEFASCHLLLPPAACQQQRQQQQQQQVAAEEKSSRREAS